MNENALKQKLLKEWWLPLSLEKRRLAICFAFVLPFVLYYLLVWYPLRNEVDFLKTKITKDEKLLALVTQASEKLALTQKAAANAKINKDIPLLTILDKEGKINTWKNSEMNMRQADNGQVEVAFTRINFDDFISGTEELVKNFNLHVERISLTRINSSEAVQASVLFRQ